ncbi:MAG: hypothetical protein K6E51_05305 [Treponema sp.]|nr:hypothetical protein [Treponema sp.]
MTREEFKSIIEVRRDFDFSFRGKRYMINAKKLSSGEFEISFGEEYASPVVYDSFLHLMAEAQIEKIMLSDALVDIVVG